LLNIRSYASSSKGNLYTIDDGYTKLMLECGLPWRDIQSKLDFGVSQIAGCLVTHEHLDHARAVPDLMKTGIDCYMSQGTAQALKLSGHRLHIIEALVQFSIGTWAIKPFSGRHAAAEPLCFLMANQSAERLLFATDTAYIANTFEGLTHVMIEANYAMPILKYKTGASLLRQSIIGDHMSLDTLIRMLRANDLSKVEEIHLLHLSNNNSDAAMFKRRIQEVTGKPVYIG